MGKSSGQRRRDEDPGSGRPTLPTGKKRNSFGPFIFYIFFISAITTVIEILHFFQRFFNR